MEKQQQIKIENLTKVPKLQ